MAARLPVLAVTIGDPSGIGPEVLLKALHTLPAARLVIVGDRGVLEATARRLKLALPRWTPTFADGIETALAGAGRLVLLDVPACARFVPGRSGPEAGAATLVALDRAVELCRRGLAQGLVTAPATKWAIQRVRPSFIGQTEYLAERFGARRVAMMFASDRLRVVVMTRHVALARVSRELTRPLVQQTAALVDEALRRQFGIARPRLAVLGVNPHAGEAGAFGDDESRVLMPAIRACRRAGLRVDGPFAADGFFAAPVEYDAVLCAYHDQGLIPFKMAARDAGAQVTLGLPVPRTSPDHGSALDIAGRGIAHPGAMRYALALAARLAARPSAHPR
jgi:4-hydroxythreonine-4-phosphate dehydrogenase